MTRGEIVYRPFPLRAHATVHPPPVRFFLVQAPRPEPYLGPPLGSFPLGLLDQLQARTFHQESGATQLVRTLSPQDGWRRIVRWGEFKQLLQPEIAHPERLRDSHRLACSVSVYEAPASLSRTELEEQLEEEEDDAVQLEPLTRDLVARLGLGAVLPEPRRARGAAQPRRFLELHPLEDPTALSLSPVLPAPKALQPVAPPAEAGTPRRTTIPSEWIRAWEFRMSRDEAIYDTQAAGTRWGRFCRGVSRLVRFAAARAAMEKWKALLTGKPIDQQLWGVRPPRQALTHGRARRWVAQALAAAGYDPVSMLDEWEIFWRRKGV